MLTNSLQRTAWILRGTGRHGARFTSTKNALCIEVVALGASMQVATRDSSRIVGKPEVIQKRGSGK
jgi:hypothetical protein